MTNQECNETMMWLRRLAGGIGAGEAKYHARHILEMLAEPRLPDDAQELILQALIEHASTSNLHMATAIYRALAPKSATKTVWGVVWAHGSRGGFTSRGSAMTWAAVNVPDTEPFSLTCAEEPA